MHDEQSYEAAVQTDTVSLSCRDFKESRSLDVVQTADW